MSNQMSCVCSSYNSRSVSEALPKEVRERMEGLFRVDFSQVRIHVGKQAPMIGATAFTQGEDIHFAPRAYQPLWLA